MTIDDFGGADVFITGGAGFIGSTLAARLVERNRVTIYDNFARDALTATGLASHPNVTVMRGDILDLVSLTEAMHGHSHVVHCAAIVQADHAEYRSLQSADLGAATVVVDGRRCIGATTDLEIITLGGGAR